MILADIDTYIHWIQHIYLVSAVMPNRRIEPQFEHLWHINPPHSAIFCSVFGSFTSIFISTSLNDHLDWFISSDGFDALDWFDASSSSMGADIVDA